MSTATRPENGRTKVVEQESPQEVPDLLSQVLQETERHRYSIQDVETMAAKAAKSGMYNMDDSQAFTLMMLAQSKGLDAIQAMERYHIIKKRPSMRADAMQADFQRSGGRVRWLNRNDDECSAEMWHPRLHPEHLVFTANARDLIDKGVATAWDEETGRTRVKDMYIKFPRQMLGARVISEGVTAIHPGIKLGLYAPEEIYDMDDDPAPAEAQSKSQLDTALAAAKRKPVAVSPEPPAAESTPAPKSDQRAWLDAEVERFNAAWQTLCLDRKVQPGKGLTSHQVVNGVVSGWIDRGELPADAVNVDGVRNKVKVGTQIKSAWEHDQQGFIEDVTDYLRGKFAELAKEAGIEVAAPETTEPPEAPDRGDAYEEAE